MSCVTSRPQSGPAQVGFRLATVVIPLHPWLIMGQKKLPPRSHSAESLEGQQVSTLVCRTYGWDPQNGAYRAATGPKQKGVSKLGKFSKCFHKNRIASGAPQSCHAACLYPGECGGMSCATSRPGPGPGRAGFRRATFAFALPSWLRTGKKMLTPRSHRAESLEGRQVSTLVCRTYGWDPPNRT